jgi:hypothetical protein
VPNGDGLRQRKKWHSPLVGALALAVAAGPMLASPAVYFDYDLDRGRDAFVNTVGLTTGTPEIWQFDFTDPSIGVGSGVFNVTGDQGTQVWARLSGPDYGGAFSPDASGIVSGSVTGGTWNDIVDNGLRVELFSDAALTTTFQFNAIGIETDDWGTCCKGLNTNADDTQTDGTAVYMVFDPTANPSGSADPDILLVGNIDATTNRTGGLPSDPDAFAGLLADGVTTNTNGHFVAAINDTAFFDDVTVAPNGAGEVFGFGGIMYLARVALGSVPAGSSAVAFGTTVASASSTPDPVGNMSVMERVLAQIDNATNLAQVNGTYVNIAENLGGTDGSGIDGSINNIVNGITESTMLARVGALSAVESILPTLDFGSMSTTTLGAVNTGEISLGVNQAVDEAKTTATGAYAAVVDQIGGSADTGALVLNIASNMTGINGSINNTMTGVNGSIGNMSTTTLGAVNTGSITSGIGSAVQGIVGLSGTNG